MTKRRRPAPIPVPDIAAAILLRVELLEQENRDLRRQLGIQRHNDVHAALRQAAMERMGPSTHTRGIGLMAALYEAGGKVLTKDALLLAVPPRDPYGEDMRAAKQVDVWVYGARSAFGREVIETVWGRGYRMSARGMAQVEAILAPLTDAPPAQVPAP